MDENERRVATIWAPLAEVRISERRRRSINHATVERYRQWLEQGHEPAPGAPRTAGQRLRGTGRPPSRRCRPGRRPRLHRGVPTTDSSDARASSPLEHPAPGDEALSAEPSFAPRRSGFDSRHLHSGLRSVNGKHAPFVRPRCGFDSCRRLCHTPVAQRIESTALRRRRPLVQFQPGVPLADVAQREEHRTANPERPVRSGSSATRGERPSLASVAQRKSVGLRTRRTEVRILSGAPENTFRKEVKLVTASASRVREGADMQRTTRSRPSRGLVYLEGSPPWAFRTALASTSAGF
jgi:hypothetical protein